MATIQYLSEDFDPAGVRLAIETPELWQTKVHGQGVDLTRGGRWLDVHTRATEAGTLLVSGENVVELEGHPFDVRQEIEAIYLLGDFFCTESDPGFSLAPPQPLSLGSWRKQVHPSTTAKSPTSSGYPKGVPETSYP